MLLLTPPSSRGPWVLATLPEEEGPSSVPGRPESWLERLSVRGPGGKNSTFYLDISRCIVISHITCIYYVTTGTCKTKP